MPGRSNNREQEGFEGVFAVPAISDQTCPGGPTEGVPQAEPRTVTSQVRRGRRPEASRRPCPVKILATGRQLGRVAN